MSDFNCDVNVTSVLDWQRSNADIVKDLVTNQQAWLDEYHCKFWNDWIEEVFTLASANEFGLGVWSIILDEPIYGYSGPTPGGEQVFGFATDSGNFGNSNFGVNEGYTYEFTIEQKRILLQLKAYKVFAMNGFVLDINKSMQNIFGEGVVLCFDNLDMTFTYKLTNQDIFDFIEEILERDLLPRPIGIEITGVELI